MSTENKYQFKGTPAPWAIRENIPYDTGGWVVYTGLGEHNKTIVRLPYGNVIPVVKSDDYYRNKANAHLIAAAPELLQACIEAYKELQFHNWHNTKTGFELTAAIHKALNIQD